MSSQIILNTPDLVAPSDFPRSLELFSDGVFKDYQPDLLGIYSKLEGTGSMYRQAGGDGCIDVAGGFWRIYRNGGNVNVLWNFCQEGSFTPPVVGWRLGTGFYTDPWDPSTRIYTTGSRNPASTTYQNVEDDVDAINSDMIGKLVNKIEQLDIEVFELKDPANTEDLEEKLQGRIDNLQSLYRKDLETACLMEEKELGVIKKKYSVNKIKMVKENKLKQENLQANFILEKREIEENRKAKKVSIEKAIQKLTINLNKLKSDGCNELNSNVKKDLECPVCLQEMKPPTHILQCTYGHLICHICNAKLETANCPTCREAQISGRNFAMERLARTIYYGQY